MEKCLVIIILISLILSIQLIKAATPSINTINIPESINLISGSTKSVVCDAIISDEDGWGDISSVNASIWHSSSNEDSEDDENDHYTNSSCLLGVNTSATEVPINCSFDLEYYSNPGTWTCKIRVYDGSSEGNNQSDTTVNDLIAINIPDTIDFGSMDLGETSTNASEEVTSVENYGNIDIDIKLSGEDMDCNPGSILVTSIRYSDTDNTAYDLMTNLTDTATTLNLNIAQRTGSSSIEDVFWRIRIPDNGVGGTCSNTIIFTAIEG